MASISPITQRILDLDPTLQIHNEGEWGGTQSLFSAFNDAGVECEVGEFLYSITRLLKPKRVLETGTHWGIGASYLGFACKENDNGGKVDTYEFLPPNHVIARQRIEKLGLWNNVSCYIGDVANVQPEENYQLIFLDTEPQTRFAELLKFYPYLDEGGFIFIHDLHPHMHQIPNEEHGFAWPYGRIPKEMDDLIKRGRLRPFHFKTPRGFTGFYKESSADHYYEIYE